MTIKEARNKLKNELEIIYQAGEADAICNWLMEALTGLEPVSLPIKQDTELTPEQQHKLSVYLKRLLANEPIQYVLNESWFCGMKFYVDENVLIPRPETEELVEWVISDCRFPIDTLSLLDIGTGSGCIPVALKRKLRKAEVWACDVSTGALEVANRNAQTLGASVNFKQLDILDKNQWQQLPEFDIIISNPPYVPESDKLSMAANVLDFEPHEALFVPDNDPLLFYCTIADFGKTHLHAGGTLYFEVHADYSRQVMQLLDQKGYTATLKKDMQGVGRMVKGGLVD